MADEGALRDEHARRRVRPRRPARRRGDDDPRPLPLTRLTLYVAEGCHLCASALEVARAVAADPSLAVELDVVDITGVDALERAYRVELPVLALDGEPVLRFEVTEGDLRAALAAAPR